MARDPTDDVESIINKTQPWKTIMELVDPIMKTKTKKRFVISISSKQHQAAASGSKQQAASNSSEQQQAAASTFSPNIVLTSGVLIYFFTKWVPGS